MVLSPFQGDRVTLRPPEPEDGPALRAYLNHPELAGRRCIPWGFPALAPLTLAQVQGIVQRWAGEEKGMPLAVVLSASDELIGHAEASWDWDPHSPSAEVVISPQYQRQGYGSEVMGLLLRYLFDYTPAHQVGCWIAEWNEQALRFLTRNGFQIAGRMRRVGMHQGRPFDMVITGILRQEWKARLQRPDLLPEPVRSEI